MNTIHNDSNDRKNCNRIIMAINAMRSMTDQERKRDLLFGILLVVLGIFIPLFSVPWLLTLGKPMVALLVTVISIGTAAVIGFARRGTIIRSFYQIKNAHDLINIVGGNDKIEELCGIDEVLLCVMPIRYCYLDVLYNWLCKRKLVEPGERVTLYEVDGEKLMPYLKDENDLHGPVQLMTFEGRLPDDARRFYDEKRVLGVYLLNDLKKHETR